MKVAVIYNRESTNVINLFGIPNREKYGLQSIQRILNALKKGGHQAVAIEGDKDLIDRLEEFMPRVIKGELPGMALNLSYGIQGQARYTHVPGILEMVGLPYVGSNPLAHSLALDKVVAKMLFVQNGVPTPEFAVIPTPDSPLPDLEFPLIVKPKNEAVSFGIQVVNNMEDLKKAALAIFKEFGQAVLVEQYIEGREINVGLLGNGPNVET
ncbi:MAG: ATP-grasp domain-containing protein, partial [Desulfobacter sp.]|nr:ATP-grasp domain-containing protein [Desulfobacter sp.]